MLITKTVLPTHPLGFLGGPGDLSSLGAEHTQDVPFSKIAQGWLKMGKDGPKMAKDSSGRLKMAPRWPKMAQDRSQDGSRWPKMAQDTPKMAQGLLKMGKDGPEMAQDYSVGIVWLLRSQKVDAYAEAIHTLFCSPGASLLT